MKRLILILAILAALLGLSLYGISYARQTRDSLGELAAQAAGSEDRASLLQAAQKLEEYWKSREPFLSFYVRHDELEKINACLSSLQSIAKSNGPAEALPLLNQLLFFANHLYERELPSLNNLF